MPVLIEESDNEAAFKHAAPVHLAKIHDREAVPLPGTPSQEGSAVTEQALPPVSDLVFRTQSGKASGTRLVCSLAQSCWRKNAKKFPEVVDSIDDDKEFNLKLTLPSGILSPTGKSTTCSEGLGSKSDRSWGMDPMLAYKLGKGYNLPSNGVAEARRTFDKYDFDGDGKLDIDEFKTLISEFCLDQLQETKDSPCHLPEDFFEGVDQSADGEVDFEEFLRWISTQSFREEVLVSHKQQKIRATARKFDLLVPEVEAVKRKFDRFDSNASGTIDQEEFTQLLTQLLKVPKNQELPTNRVLTFWREIDCDGSGVVDFEEFLPWYMRYFPLDGGVTASPIESFYASVRGRAHQDGAVHGAQSILCWQGN